MNATRDVCRQLIDARERLDLTVTQVARRGMWGHAQVSNIEAARNSPSVETLARYVAALGLSELTITIRVEQR